ncbi:hypothetical protein [Sphaerisporangium siamense]|uniref:Ribosomal protein L16/L10AE n=1 Tax=Sphaerisporangium siamense TaxID=795645 RepID=A0A7W7D936_9ACTN|nr:hypothetical protein [Sphaerisporangium siamense]MBB4702538.1 ribosomal protein L16/L10AE [Sphaerisporangium siamense]
MTAVDTVTGEEATAQVRPGDYALICAEPCWLEHTQVDPETGTVTITLKGYRGRHG